MLAQSLFVSCLLLSILSQMLYALSPINDSDFQEWQVLNPAHGQRRSGRKSKRTNKNSAEERPLTIDDFLMFRQLCSANGLYLQILPSGVVKATTSDHDIFAILRITYENEEIVTIRGVRTGLFLAMSRRGEMFGSKKKTKECYFKKIHVKEWYFAFKSVKYPRQPRRRQRRKSWYLSLQKNGIPKIGSKARLRKSGTKFLIRPVEPEQVPELYPFPIEVLSSQ